MSQLNDARREALEAQGVKLTVIVVPADESAKHIRVAEQVWAQMVAAGCDRSSLVLALGGGVVGDLAGFVAATYMRGIAYIQVPTTLLAMVDSAIGGKTAVNLQAGKNLVGAIYQPKAVLVDPEFLFTLPERNVVSSLAEVIKYGFIRDATIFDTVEAQLDELIRLENRTVLTELIFKSARIKAQIVSADQFESGERMLLNFGHTIGHAFETLQAYSGLYHGEAVIYGMRCANHISHQKGLLSDAEFQRGQTVLKQFKLPPLGELDAEQVLKVVAHDKKYINGRLHFILLKGLGEAVINTEVSEQDIVDSLAAVS